MKKEKLMLRTIILIAGLLFLAFGVALSIKSGLGVSPSSSFSYLMSEIFPVSMGTVTILVNIGYMLVQVVLLGKDYKVENLLQLVAVFLFGYFTDFTNSLLSSVSVDAYWLRLAVCILSCALMGFGLYLEINARLLTMPSEGALSLISRKTGKEFGAIKIINDCSFVTVSLIISLVVLKKVIGIREGTFLAAILVGLFSQICSRVLPFFRKEPETVELVDAMQYPLVITIERELGSGGHHIGAMLAKSLGIPFYDYNLIEKTAAQTGLSNELVEKKEERVLGLWYTLYNQSYGYTSQESDTDKIFEAQKKVVRDLAARESCVIVGRLSAYILRNRPNTFNVFISADQEYRVNQLLAEKKMSREEMLQLVKKEDAMRKAYCQHFTGKPWGLARHYHLCIDSSVYGRLKTFDLIYQAIMGFLEKNSNPV